MSVNVVRGESDPIMAQIVEALKAYQVDSPTAKIDIYRQNSVSVRVRIVDEAFAGMSRVERNRTVWKYLERLAEEDQADLSTLILLTPRETSKSFANFEFDNPVASAL